MAWRDGDAIQIDLSLWLTSETSRVRHSILVVEHCIGHVRGQVPRLGADYGYEKPVLEQRHKKVVDISG